MKTFYILLGAVALIGVVAIVYAARSGGGNSMMATQAVQLDQIPNGRELTERARGVSIGADNAPVSMLVFSDFQCPGCGIWAGRIEPLLKAEFVQTGKLRMTYYDYPIESIHAHAFLAARAARCAEDQNKFWEYHDRLFATQQQWSYSGRAPVELFTNLAGEVGAERTAFESCLRSDRHAELVTANQMLGNALRIGGTPTIFVNSRNLDDWANYDAVKRAIEQAAGN